MQGSEALPPLKTEINCGIFSSAANRSFPSEAFDALEIFVISKGSTKHHLTGQNRQGDNFSAFLSRNDVTANGKNRRKIGEIMNRLPY